jgi:putative dimethyl sulfoxide reductase chaperone
MSELAARMAFAGNAFLTPEPARLLELAQDAGLDPRIEESLVAGSSELEREYNRLFLNPLGTPCPPWQSAQGEAPQLMGQAHLDALEWFRRYGVEPSALNEPADHAGLLLLFGARLLASDVPLEECRAFAHAHLSWLVAFSERIDAEARLPFYSLLAAHTREAVVELTHDNS